MHGTSHDFVVLCTVKDGNLQWSGESHDGGKIEDHPFYKTLKGFKKQKTQKIFKRVLEIGSLDVNGSQRNYTFLGKQDYWTRIIGCEEYIGIDSVAGKGVDIHIDAHDIEYKNEFDLVLCLNMLEHDSNPPKTVSNAYKALKKGGLFVSNFSNETDTPHHFNYRPIKSVSKVMKAFKTYQNNTYGGHQYVVAKK